MPNLDILILLGMPGFAFQRLVHHNFLEKFLVTSNFNQAAFYCIVFCIELECAHIKASETK